MNVNDLITEFPALANAVAVLIESARNNGDDAALSKWDELREVQWESHYKRRVVEIRTAGVDGYATVIAVLDDGSILEGVTVEVKSGDYFPWATGTARFRIEGEVKP